MKLIPLIFALLLAGCVSTLPLTEPVPDLRLATAQTRKAGNTTVTFPAGRYVATFRTKDATFYRSEAVIRGWAGDLHPDSGFAIRNDGRHGFHVGNPYMALLDRPLDLAP